MPLDVVGLLTHLNLECQHLTLCEDKQNVSIDIDLLNFTIGNLLLDRVLLAHVDVCDVDVSLFVRDVQQFLLLIPADRGIEALVGVGHAEELVFVLAVAFDGLVIPNGKDATLLFHNVQNLNYAKPMQTSLLVTC